jgi:hypothetical protein
MSCWAWQLQKCLSDLEDMHICVHQNRLHWICHYEVDHHHSIKDLNFSTGNLVLACNMQVEKTFSVKYHMQYMGPLVIIHHNHSGAYIVAELNGTVWQNPVGAFQIIPYFACTALPIPDLTGFINISCNDLTHLKVSEDSDPLEGEFDVLEEDA